jgi:hypothetical protein
VAEPPVVNASPLIFLARTGLLDLLRLIAETVMEPTSMTTEIQRRGPVAITAQALGGEVVLCTSPPAEERQGKAGRRLRSCESRLQGLADLL